MINTFYLYTASINYKVKISQQVLPLHVALHPHLVREVPHQHPHHPQTSNSPTNPVKSIARSSSFIISKQFLVKVCCVNQDGTL